MIQNSWGYGSTLTQLEENAKNLIFVGTHNSGSGSWLVMTLYIQNKFVLSFYTNMICLNHQYDIQTYQVSIHKGAILWFDGPKHAMSKNFCSGISCSIMRVI